MIQEAQDGLFIVVAKCLSEHMPESMQAILRSFSLIKHTCLLLQCCKDGILIVGCKRGAQVFRGSKGGLLSMHAK